MPERALQPPALPENSPGGAVHMDGRDVGTIRGAALKQFRRIAQMGFQDPYDSPNPRLAARHTVEEPLTVDVIRQRWVEGRLWTER